MRGSNVNSLIMQNRLLSQSKARARSQSANVNKAIKGDSSDKDKLLKAIKNQANRQVLGTGETEESALENYTIMKKSAESLKKHTENLLLLPEKEWDKLTPEESTAYKESAFSELNAMVEDYNQVIKALAGAGGKVEEIYLKQLKGYFQNAKTDLGTIGLTQNSDGTILVDQELLKTAVPETLKELLGRTGTFVEDVGKRAQNVSDNAKTNLALLNKSRYAGNYSYNQYGSDIYDAFNGSSRYNAKG